MLNVIASRDNICKYVELPLQHVSDRVLRAMHRSGDKAYIQQLIDRIKTIVSGVALHTSFIVGFPGETEEDFAELCAFIEEKQFNHVGIFTYSPEEGTPAAALPDQVLPEVKEERRRVAMELQQKISRRKNEGLVGQVAEVLIDRIGQGNYIGRTRFQAPDIDGVTYLQGRNLHPGDLVMARITEALDYDLKAVVE
jgi:ribosomal protein S12 methylthiotransferase